MNFDYQTIAALVTTAFTSGFASKALTTYSQKRKQDAVVDVATAKEDTARHRLLVKERGEERGAIERQLDRKTNDHCTVPAKSRQSATREMGLLRQPTS